MNVEQLSIGGVCITLIALIGKIWLDTSRTSKDHRDELVKMADNVTKALEHNAEGNAKLAISIERLQSHCAKSKEEMKDCMNRTKKCQI